MVIIKIVYNYIFSTYKDFVWFHSLLEIPALQISHSVCLHHSLRNPSTQSVWYITKSVESIMLIGIVPNTLRMGAQNGSGGNLPPERSL